MTAPRIPLLVPVLRGNERAYLAECVDSNFVSSVGPFVKRFEREFAGWLGAEHAVACASGTAALHLALVALGVGPGDDVLVSDLTFIASANPARYCGAAVMLVDSEPRTWNIDPALVEEELRRRAQHGARMPAAIVAVHVLGHPAELDRILSVAAEFGVPVVEDAAESLGASWTSGPLAGRQTGTAARMGIFSFNGNKVLTTGGGGMVVTGDAGLAERLRHLSTQARVPGEHYVHDMIGFNYRLTNVAAAVGVAQLEQLDSFLRRKREIAHRYDAAFVAVPDVTLPPATRDAERSAWLYSIQLSSRVLRDDVAVALRARGIESRPVWDPVHSQAPYRGATVLGGGTVASALAGKGLSLPSSADLDDDQVDEVVSAVVEAVAAGART
jgi:dTDP-4-amino-4,6-dideoxygalactose transaminase